MKNRIREIEEQIAELKSRLPAHSLQPRMFQELEDLETELDNLKAKVNIKIHKFNPQQMEKLDNPKRYIVLPPEEVIRLIPIDQGMKLADIGCAIGYFTFPLAKALGESGTVFGLDISEEMLLEARKRYEKLIDTKIASVEFLISEENKLPFLPNTLDVAFVANVLHETEDKFEFLSEVARVLRPGGRLIIVEWAKEVMEMGPPVNKRLSLDEVIGYLKSSGFELVLHQEVGKGHYMIIAVTT